MRLFKKNKIYVKSFVLHRHRVCFILMAAVVTVIAAYILSELINPYVTEISKKQVELCCTGYVNDSILNVLSEEACEYERFISIVTDKEGKITALRGNTVEMNKIRTQISDEITQMLEKMGNITVSIPVFHIFRNSFITSPEVDVAVKVVPFGNADIDFESSFESCGVNQTKHEININTYVNYTILTPAGRVDGAVSVSVPMAQTVIVGDVPDNYINVLSSEEELKSDVLELAP